MKVVSSFNPLLRRSWNPSIHKSFLYGSSISRMSSSSSIPLEAPPKWKLIYFDVPGRGEAIRWACAYGKLPLEEERITREEFRNLKAQGKFPFGQIPILIVENGTVLAQSPAILKYIGTYAGLYPRSDLILSAVIDSLVEQNQDMMIALNGTRFPERLGFSGVTQDQLTQARQKVRDEILPQHFQYFENFLNKSKTGWLASTPNPTIADFAVVARLFVFTLPDQFEGITPDILKPFPKCLELIKRVQNLPGVKEYSPTIKK